MWWSNRRKSIDLSFPFRFLILSLALSCHSFPKVCSGLSVFLNAYFTPCSTEMCCESVLYCCLRILELWYAALYLYLLQLHQAPATNDGLIIMLYSLDRYVKTRETTVTARNIVHIQSDFPSLFLICLFVYNLRQSKRYVWHHKASWVSRLAALLNLAWNP